MGYNGIYHQLDMIFAIGSKVHAQIVQTVIIDDYSMNLPC